MKLDPNLMWDERFVFTQNAQHLLQALILEAL